MFETLGGRKLVACLIILIVVIVFVAIKGDITGNLADMLKYLITTYIAGNVGTDVVTALSSKKTQETEVTPSADVTNDIESLRASIDQTAMLLTNEAAAKNRELEGAIGQLALNMQQMQTGLQYVIERVPPVKQQAPTPQPVQYPAPQQFVSPPRRVEKPVERFEAEQTDFNAPAQPQPQSSLANPFNTATIPQHLITNQNPLY